MIVKIQIKENCMKRLAAIQPRILPALRDGIGESLEIVEKRMRGNISAKFRSRTGRGLKSVRASKVTMRGNTVFGGLPNKPRAKGSGWYYLWFHEKGATIVPKKAKYLRIPFPDGTIRKVKRVVLPAKPWFSPAIDETLPKIRKIIKKRLEAIFR